MFSEEVEERPVHQSVSTTTMKMFKIVKLEGYKYERPTHKSFVLTKLEILELIDQMMKVRCENRIASSLTQKNSFIKEKQNVSGKYFTRLLKNSTQHLMTCCFQQSNARAKHVKTLRTIRKPDI